MATITGTGQGTEADDIISGEGIIVDLSAINRIWFLRTKVEEVINFSDAQYSVDEDAGEVEITYVRSSSRPSSPLQFNVVTTPGTATQGVNYLNATSPILFEADENVVTTTVPILNAGLATGQSRVFTMSLGVPPSRLAYRRGTLSLATITIHG